MEMQQMMEMLARMDANMKSYHEKLEADRKADMEEREADRKVWREKIATETRATQARTAAMRENMGTSHKEMAAVFEPGRDMETMACREITEAHLEEKETMACQEMEARPEEEPTSLDRKP
jgi:hypothetical protein